LYKAFFVGIKLIYITKNATYFFKLSQTDGLEASACGLLFPTFFPDYMLVEPGQPEAPASALCELEKNTSLGSIFLKIWGNE
jgi:hypothetical protein